MKKIRLTSFLVLIFMFIYILSVQILAEERSCYIGDLIKIEISTQEFTGDEIRDKFKEFEIVDLKDTGDGWLITIRSFEPGESTVVLGNKELVVDIKLTLDEIDGTDVFEGDMSVDKAGLLVEWRYIFYAIAAAFLVTGGFNLYRLMKQRRSSSLSPYRLFLNHLDSVDLNDGGCFVHLTKSFKEYLEASFFCRIRGKTSTEIIREIENIPELEQRLPVIGSWLKESDYCKFTGVNVLMETKQELLERLIEVVGEIEKGKEGEI